MPTDCAYSGHVGDLFLANLQKLGPSRTTADAVRRACSCGQHRVCPCGGSGKGGDGCSCDPPFAR